MEITHVRIETARPAELRRFYADTLGLPVTDEGEFTVTIGATALTVTPAAAGTDPAYHLAFTIPRNQLAAAKTWVAARTPLLTGPDGQDQFRFDNWEAEAIYFADPAANILELIAWDTLANDTSHPFGPADLLAVSEAGVVVPDVPATVAHLGDLGFPPYADDWSPEFAPVGDAIGRLIVVPTARPWFPIGAPAVAAPLSMTLRGSAPATLTLPNTHTTITVTT